MTVFSVYPTDGGSSHMPEHKRQPSSKCGGTVYIERDQGGIVLRGDCLIRRQVGKIGGVRWEEGGIKI